jgi:hypothetical protein
VAVLLPLFSPTLHHTPELTEGTQMEVLTITTVTYPIHMSHLALKAIKWKKFEGLLSHKKHKNTATHSSCKDIYSVYGTRYVSKALSLLALSHQLF